MTTTAAARAEAHRRAARRETRALRAAAANHSTALRAADRALGLLAEGDYAGARDALTAARDRLSGPVPECWQLRYARLRRAVNVLLDDM